MQALLVHFFFTAFLCFAKVALSNNVELLPQLRADLTRVLANVALSKERVALLHQAAKLGQTQVVEQLLAEGVKLRERDDKGKLAYENALEAGHYDLAAELMGSEEMLLRAVVAEDKFGNFGRYDEMFIDWIGERQLIPAIKNILVDPQISLSATVRAQLAVIADDEVMFQQALDAGAHHQEVWQLLGLRPELFEQVIARLEEGSLHHAAAYGNREAMAALLAEGADINAVDGYGWQALDYAVFSGRTEATRDLCEADADVCVFDRKHMLGADAPTVEILRAYAGDKDPLKEFWLHYYIRTGQTARAINHIKSYYDPNKLIYIGVMGVGVGDYTHRENMDGSWLHLRMDSALHAAALYGNLELVKYLIETMQMDVNYKDTSFLSSGNTALHMTAVGNHVDVASYLLERGADVHARDRVKNSREDIGLTAMHYAAAYGNLEMAVFLAANGGDVNAVGYGNGYNYWSRISTLQLAIEGKANLELVKFLIKKLGLFKKRKINRADGRGLTPLYRAIRTKNVDMVELLLVNGADPAVIGNEEISGIRYDANKNKDTVTLRIVELLENHSSR